MEKKRSWQSYIVRDMKPASSRFLGASGYQLAGWGASGGHFFYISKWPCYITNGEGCAYGGHTN
jgi:hypothetical protein